MSFTVEPNFLHSFIFHPSLFPRALRRIFTSSTHYFNHISLPALEISLGIPYSRWFLRHDCIAFAQGPRETVDSLAETDSRQILDRRSLIAVGLTFWENYRKLPLKFHFFTRIQRIEQKFNESLFSTVFSNTVYRFEKLFVPYFHTIANESLKKKIVIRRKSVKNSFRFIKDYS